LFLDAVADGHVEPGSILFVESFDRISRADLFTAMGVLGKLLEAGITVVAGDREYTHAIFRASGLSLLGVSNSHVETDRRKIVRGEQQSPILLVRDKARGRVIIADGYHRLCAVYTFDEDALIPCRIV
jgi:DNA invertase Pin-like site-specific DNA recombinase